MTRRDRILGREAVHVGKTSVGRASRHRQVYLFVNAKGQTRMVWSQRMKIIREYSTQNNCRAKDFIQQRLHGWFEDNGYVSPLRALDQWGKKVGCSEYLTCKSVHTGYTASVELSSIAPPIECEHGGEDCRRGVCGGADQGDF